MQHPIVICGITSYFPFVGGAEVALRETAHRLGKDFEVQIVCARQKRALPRREKFPEGAVIRLGLGSRFDKWLLPLLTFFYLIRARRSHPARPILLWGMDISQGALGMGIFSFFFPRIPFVFTIQYGEGEERLSKGRGGFIGRSFRFLLSRAHAVTAISRHLAAIAEEYGYKGSAHIIHNGADIERFTNHELRITNHENKVVITVSRLAHKNGVDTLIRAIAEVKKEIPKIRCHIIGDGAERKSLKSLVLDLGLKDEVIFFGNVPHEAIPGYLHNADIFARASRSEGMGNAFAEALAAGIPVIGTRVGGIGDIIEEGVTGLFAKSDDAGDLAQKIIALLRDSALYARIKDEGRKKAEAFFSWDLIADKYRRLFLELLRPRPRVLIATGIFPPDVGGPATYSKIMSEALPGAGIQARICSFGDVRRFPKIIRHALYLIQLLDHGRGANFIFAQDPVSVGVPAAMAAGILRKKFVMKIVGDYAWEQSVQRFGVRDLLDGFLKKRYGARIEFLRVLEKWSARKARRIIVPSRYLKSVVAQWGIDEKKISVIYNAYEFPEELLPTKEDARKALLLDGTVIVSVGRLVPWKGFSMLIDILPALVKNIPDFMLVIIGSGPMEEKLNIRARMSGARDRIRFTGSISRMDVLRYLGAGDIFVLNSGYEGFSHTLLEAMAVGIPVIAARAGGNTELILHKKNGVLVEWNNRGEILRAIEEVHSMPELLRAEITQEAKTRARAFSEKRMIQETCALFKALDLFPNNSTSLM